MSKCKLCGKKKVPRIREVSKKLKLAPTLGKQKTTEIIKSLIILSINRNFVLSMRF